ncbi:MAG: MMPL family transporter, partial [bacterium]|nr:MMPL family transporter [bacterium]
SISAILQLALSMDYSIMLMNRYDEEKLKIKNNNEAMKNALYHSFRSICSSSITTVVGLIALVFMSFTIGKDMGFVLAKGVICSLISTFFVLPGLILIFNKLIDKTRKKSLKINMNKIGELSYKFRYLFLILFLCLFIVSYLLKGNLKIFYIDNSISKIDKIFKPDNQIVVMYKNKDESKISSYCKDLSENTKLNSVLCYGNTIGESLTYDSMNKRFKDLKLDTSIDDYLIKLIYYNYYNSKNDKISFNDFIKFIDDVAYKNEDIHISSNMKEEVNKLKIFTDIDFINTDLN